MSGPLPHLGIVAGLQSEARCVLPYVSAGKRVSIALSGARADGVRTACTRLIAEGATHLLSFGLAGGLDWAVRPGILLVPDRLAAEDGREWRVDQAWHHALLDIFRDLQPAIGLHLGSELAIASATEKAALFSRTSALAVDMESHLMAEAAVAAGLPFAILRVVCDPAEDALPPAALSAIRPDGSTNVLAVLGSVLRQPGQIPALMRLARSAKEAERVLRLCGQGLTHAAPPEDSLSAPMN